MKVRYKVTPARDRSADDIALSFLMVLSLRSRRFPTGDTRTRIVEEAGYVAGLDRTSYSFWLVLNPPNGSHFADIASVLNLILAPVEYDFADDVWIDQVYLPDALETYLGGPIFGVDGIREKFFPGTHRRPLLGFTISNKISEWALTIEHVRGCLKGGIDFLADDILDPAGFDQVSSIARIRAIKEIILRSRQAPVPYFVNLCSFNLMSEETVELMIQEGVNGFIINPQVTGWDHANWFRKMVGERGVVIHTNMGSGLGSRYASKLEATTTVTGLAEGIVSYLSRATGADAVHAGTSDTACFDKDWDRPVELLFEPHSELLGCFRIAEGDITPNNLFANMKRLGTDLFIEANSAIYGHPDGPEKGTKAFKEVIDIIDPDWGEDVDVREELLKSGTRLVKKTLQAFDYDPKVK